MASWDDWAVRVVECGSVRQVAGCVLYNPTDGNVWGRNGEIDCQSSLNEFDKKAANPGDDKACPPKINGKKFTFIKVTQDDIPCNVFKSGVDSFFTLPGPSTSRIAVYVKEGKPEPAMDKVVSYVKKSL